MIEYLTDVGTILESLSILSSLHHSPRSHSMPPLGSTGLVERPNSSTPMRRRSELSRSRSNYSTLEFNRGNSRRRRTLSNIADEQFLLNTPTSENSKLPSSDQGRFECALWCNQLVAFQFACFYFEIDLKLRIARAWSALATTSVQCYSTYLRLLLWYFLHFSPKFLNADIIMVYCLVHLMSFIN